MNKGAVIGGIIAAIAIGIGISLVVVSPALEIGSGPPQTGAKIGEELEVEVISEPEPEEEEGRQLTVELEESLALEGKP